MVFVQHHIAVLQHGYCLACLHLVTDRRERLEEAFLHLLKQFPARLLPTAQLAVVKILQGLAYRFVERCEVMEHHPFDVSIDRAVHQLDGILHESLVLRMACPCREHGHVIEFCHSGKVLIDDGLIAVASCNCRLQVVRDDSHRSTAEEVERILAGHDKVFLLLGPYGLTISVMAAWQDCHEYLHAAHLTGLSIHNLKLVAGIVDIHLVASSMFDMAYCPCLVPVLANSSLEIGILVTIRVLSEVFLMERLDGHALAAKPLHIVGYQSVEFHSARRRLAAAVTVVKEHFLKLVFMHSHQLFKPQTAFLIPAHILAHCVTRDIKSTRNAFYSHSHSVTSQ